MVKNLLFIFVIVLSITLCIPVFGFTCENLHLFSDKRAAPLNMLSPNLSLSQVSLMAGFEPDTYLAYSQISRESFLDRIFPGHKAPDIQKTYQKAQNVIESLGGNRDELEIDHINIDSISNTDSLFLIMDFVRKYNAQIVKRTFIEKRWIYVLALSSPLDIGPEAGPIYINSVKISDPMPGIPSAPDNKLGHICFRYANSSGFASLLKNLRKDLPFQHNVSEDEIEKTKTLNIEFEDITRIEISNKKLYKKNETRNDKNSEAFYIEMLNSALRESYATMRRARGKDWEISYKTITAGEASFIDDPANSGKRIYRDGKGAGLVINISRKNPAILENLTEFAQDLQRSAEEVNEVLEVEWTPEPRLHSSIVPTVRKIDTELPPWITNQTMIKEMQTLVQEGFENFTITFKGILIMPEGSIIAVGFVDNDNIFNMRKRLKERFGHISSNVWRRTIYTQIGRIVTPFNNNNHKPHKGAIIEKINALEEKWKDKVIGEFEVKLSDIELWYCDGDIINFKVSKAINFAKTEEPSSDNLANHEAELTPDFGLPPYSINGIITLKHTDSAIAALINTAI